MRFGKQSFSEARRKAGRLGYEGDIQGAIYVALAFRRGEHTVQAAIDEPNGEAMDDGPLADGSAEHGHAASGSAPVGSTLRMRQRDAFCVASANVLNCGGIWRPARRVTRG